MRRREGQAQEKGKEWDREKGSGRGGGISISFCSAF